MGDNESLILRALEGNSVDRTPVWFMRQAGRYLPEYRALRERYSILQIIRNAELSAEVTLQPIKRFEVDAAVIFADILPPLIAMGLDLEFVKGDGPVIHHPIERTYDVDILAVPPARETLSSTLDAIRFVAAELDPRHIPVVGFAGAPFTLASYAIEGGTSRTFTKTKAFMYSEPAAWKRLMTKLVTFQIDYLKAQAEAGARVLQLFDSWAGLALGREEYREKVLPYNQELFGALEGLRLPLIN
ncbi:MAG TPA: uroporphyrinogen decarboxylase family protein, partial [Spirochaetia bacterium]|nr:uroporphyrinogen decarboxylase family protein [Spirochaetia bacterium]